MDSWRNRCKVRLLIQCSCEFWVLFVNRHSMYSEGEGHDGSKLPKGKDSPALEDPNENPFLQWHEAPEDSLVLIVGILKKVKIIQLLKGILYTLSERKEKQRCKETASEVIRLNKRKRGVGWRRGTHFSKVPETLRAKSHILKSKFKERRSRFWYTYHFNLFLWLTVLL